MLAITVRVGKCVFIDVGTERITLQIVDANAQRVKLGFEAPKEFRIIREEIARQERE